MERICALKFSNDGNYITSGSSDSSIIKWEIITGN